MDVRGRGEDKTTANSLSARSGLNPQGCLTMAGDTMAHMSVSARVSTTGIWHPVVRVQ